MPDHRLELRGQDEMALDRQTLDMTGARQGQLFEHTLQMGDEMVTLANIATIAIETQQFQAFDMPRNRTRQRIALVGSSFAFIAAILCLAWWGLSAAGLLSSIALATILLSLLFVALLARAMWLSHKISRVQDYYRLSIGASDGRTVSLVDDSRAVLEEIRDVIRRKIDTRDHTTTGHFDLNTDTVNVTRGGQPAAGPASPAGGTGTWTATGTATGTGTGAGPESGTNAPPDAPGGGSAA